MLGPLLDVVFPPRCAGCGRGPAPFCERCLETLRALAPPWCSRCGAPEVGARPLSAGCRWCPDEGISSVRSGFVHDGAVRSAILRCKFGGWRRVAGDLGRAVIPIARDDVDAVTWVPLGRRRRRARGFDQAQLIAGPISRGIGRPCVRLLRRDVEIGEQARRSAAERRVALLDAYRAIGPAPHRVLLVDDVFTTGATALACAGALSRAGAREVHVLTVARAFPAWWVRGYTPHGSASGTVVARGIAPR